jgi:tyrosine-protein kinase
VSRLYDALRKVEEQGREAPPNSAKPIVAPPRNPDQLLAVPSVPVRIGSDSRIIVSNDPRGPGSERFRLIRMALRNAAGGKLPKVLLITSPLPKDGKSTVALNLASSLSERGKYKILLMEADLHRPSVLTALGLDWIPGLSEVLQGAESPFSVIRHIEPLAFYLMSAGRSLEHPSEMFQGERFSSVLQDLKASFDCILLDCPPAFPLADVVALKAHAEGVLLVARAGATPREAVRETIQLFKPGLVLGLVLNAEEEVNRAYSNYHYRYRSSESSTPPRSSH